MTFLGLLVEHLGDLVDTWKQRRAVRRLAARYGVTESQATRALSGAGGSSYVAGHLLFEAAYRATGRTDGRYGPAFDTALDEVTDRELWRRREKHLHEALRGQA